jgi:hypothetical protein
MEQQRPLQWRYPCGTLSLTMYKLSHVDFQHAWRSPKKVQLKLNSGRMIGVFLRSLRFPTVITVWYGHSMLNSVIEGSFWLCIDVWKIESETCVRRQRLTQTRLN